MDEGTYRGLDFVGLDLSGRIAESVEFAGSHFSGVDLSASLLDKSVFADCLLEHCNVANMRAEQASLRRVWLSAARMTGLQLINGVLRNVEFDQCRLDLATFRFCRLTNTVFTSCNLTRVDFTNADLRQSRFVDCVLVGAQFSHADLTGTRFTRCELVDINGVTNLRGAVVDQHNLVELAYTLATALGITIEQDR